MLLWISYSDNCSQISILYHMQFFGWKFPSHDRDWRAKKSQKVRSPNKKLHDGIKYKKIKKIKEKNSKGIHYLIQRDECSCMHLFSSVNFLIIIFFKMFYPWMLIKGRESFWF